MLRTPRPFMADVITFCMNKEKTFTESYSYYGVVGTASLLLGLLLIWFAGNALQDYLQTGDILFISSKYKISIPGAGGATMTFAVLLGGICFMWLGIKYLNIVFKFKKQ